jgi:two-component system, chemotaxis family, sensor kinase CheA
MSDEPFDREEFVAYFRDEAEELLQQIDADLLKLEGCVSTGRSDVDIVNSLFRALHTIKGSGAMLGFADVASLAHKLENLCDLLRKDRMPLSESCVDVLFSGRDLLTDFVQSAVSGASPPSGLSEFLARLDEFVAIYQETSHVIEGKLGQELTFEEAARRETQEVSAAEVDAFEAEVARLLAEAQARPDVAPHSAETPKAAKPGDDRHKRVSIHQTVRVDIARLDALLDLVGELVINRTRISDIAATLERASAGPNAALAKELVDSVSSLARTTNEIQESIMNVRMVPIGQVFDRFPRLVRDVAKARGKEVQLTISGAQTDLDKTIVDEVGEPLMHLLRNSLDHGIETPEVREARGKSRVGTIALNAYHEGNQIIIEVADDGGGIELEKVRARGIRQGLISSDDRLTDRELIELIFTPGFSTAEVISEVSGRGVGMDVVKKNIVRLKGVFDVDSVAGQGTRFTIKLPLTLAIIQALLVRVVDELYAIPLDSVIESQRVEMSEVHTIHGSEVITVRGQVVPLVRIADFFSLGGGRDPDKIMIVIVGLQGRQVGLVVDAFEGEQEIVIKPLSELVGRTTGISGATILGNGSISLIIDVHALVSEAYAGSRTARAEFSGVKGS